MSSVALSLTFGSFGDITTALELGIGVVRNLARMRGVAQMYSDFLLELETILQSLSILQKNLRSPLTNIASLGMSYEAFRYGLDARIASCTVFFQKMQREISNFQEQFKRKRTDWTVLMYKAPWLLFPEQLLGEYRAQARQHKEWIDLAVLVLNQRVTDKTHVLVARTGMTLEDVAATTQAIHCDMKLVLRDIYEMREITIRSLGYPWEGGLSADQYPIKIIGPLGVTIWLPVDLFTTWEHIATVIGTVTTPALRSFLGSINAPEKPSSVTQVTALFTQGVTEMVHIIAHFRQRFVDYSIDDGRSSFEESFTMMSRKMDLSEVRRAHHVEVFFAVKCNTVHADQPIELLSWSTTDPVKVIILSGRGSNTSWGSEWTYARMQDQSENEEGEN
ncbi:hypothetical protein NEOLEDRAFT_1245647 [Neolentinus lepideus HHB14362 ss-1]|uniref:Fungal N-terminal domain-containing protein n=1 Tax=Neolentinus lepideus HHB14362 ss-1 TaxID=1314782 RepID=A0A165NJK0_9AGAM|nr:hypothetical protein NEOLEDRAFT_1245647 [Neolentinus lepideus HHB14362 ss-1]